MGVGVVVAAPPWSWLAAGAAVRGEETGHAAPEQLARLLRWVAVQERLVHVAKRELESSVTARPAAFLTAGGSAGASAVMASGLLSATPEGEAEAASDASEGPFGGAAAADAAAAASERRLSGLGQLLRTVCWDPLAPSAAADVLSSRADGHRTVAAGALRVWEPDEAEAALARVAGRLAAACRGLGLRPGAESGGVVVARGGGGRGFAALTDGASPPAEWLPFVARRSTANGPSCGLDAAALAMLWRCAAAAASAAAQASGSGTAVGAAAASAGDSTPMPDQRTLDLATSQRATSKTVRLFRGDEEVAAAAAALTAAAEANEALAWLRVLVEAAEAGAAARGPGGQGGGPAP